MTSRCASRCSAAAASARGMRRRSRSCPSRMRLVACCGRDPSATAAFAARHGASAFTDFDAHACRGDAGPADRRPAALRARRPGRGRGARRRATCWSRSRSRSTWTGPRRWSRRCATAGVVGACGFMYRFGEAVEAWDAAAGRGRRAGHFSGQFHCNALHAPWWRERDKSGGQMVEQLIHIIDLARHALGMPQTRLCAGGEPLSPRRARLRRRGRERDHPRLRRRPHRRAARQQRRGAGPLDQGWQIVAERMTGIFADWNNAELVRTDGEVTSRPHRRRRATSSSRSSRDVAARHPRAAASRACRSRTGAASLRIALAARRSADERREVAL